VGKNIEEETPRDEIGGKGARFFRSGKLGSEELQGREHVSVKITPLPNLAKEHEEESRTSEQISDFARGRKNRRQGIIQIDEAEPKQEKNPYVSLGRVVREG